MHEHLETANTSTLLQFAEAKRSKLLNRTSFGPMLNFVQPTPVMPGASVDAGFLLDEFWGELYDLRMIPTNGKTVIIIPTAWQFAEP